MGSGLQASLLYMHGLLEHCTLHCSAYRAHVQLQPASTTPKGQSSGPVHRASPPITASEFARSHGVTNKMVISSSKLQLMKQVMC